MRSRTWAHELQPCEQRPLECFSMMRSHFQTEISAWPGKLLVIQELHVTAELTLFLKFQTFESTRSELRRLFARMSPQCWTNFYGFAYNSLISLPFSTHEVLNQRSWCDLLNSQKLVNQILLLTWSWSWSNFGQLWSNLVNIDQTFPNLTKYAPGKFWEIFYAFEPLLGRTRLVWLSCFACQHPRKP